MLSKYAWVVPLKDKTGKSLVDAFDAVFKKDGRVPERLQTDAGKKFLNKEFQRILASKNVRHFVTYNETKAQIVERFNRTLKNRMWRYFTFQNGRRYVEALPALVEGYNKAYHRSIGTAPERVTQANAQEIWHRLYGKDFVKRSTRVRFKFKVYPLRLSVFNRMAHLQHDDFYLVLTSYARSEGVHDNRPQHFKVDLPKELFLEGEWEVGVTELLYTHTFYEPSRFALTYDLSDSDLMWEFTNRNVYDWIAVHFPRELYGDKSYRRLVLSMMDTLKEVGDKTGVGPGIDIVDLRDRFHVTMDPGASLRFSLPIAHMLGFVDDNFALRSQYKDGRFQIQHGVQRMSLVWVEQSGLPLRFEIAPLHGTANDNPRPFPRVESFSIASNLNIEPVFDGYKKSRDLRKIVTKRTSHVQETFRNVHFFKLEQRRIKRVEIA